jgi:protein-tyrosine phosphatase
VTVRAAGEGDQHGLSPPDWGVYADPCWKHWPGVVLDWPDFGVPSDAERALAAILDALARARSGEDVLVGCRGGLGRTGTILGALAIATGVPAELARGWVRRRYKDGAVETDQQHDWLRTVVSSNSRIRASAINVRDRRFEDVASRLRREMAEALHAGSREPILAWAVESVLAITQRPLRAHPFYGGSRSDYPVEARPEIDAWIEDLQRQGIASVIALTSNKELGHYYAPTCEIGGLLALYRAAGLLTAHFPADDPAHDLTARGAFDEAVDHLAAAVARDLRRLPLPAVLHCSAAIDRSPPVASRVAFMAEVDML